MIIAPRNWTRQSGIKRYARRCCDSQDGHQRDMFPGVKGGRSACVRLELRAWALKCIEKRRLYIRRAYLWVWARSERRGKRQKEAIGMDAASGSGLGRSTNRPTIEPSDQPVRNGRSTLLLTVPIRRKREGEREDNREQERRDEGSNRERERADA